MDKKITINKIFFVFAKLQLCFHLSHYYRCPGFYSEVDEMMNLFEDAEVAYNIIIERVMSSPEEFREEHSIIDRKSVSADFEGSVEDWVEEMNQIDDLFFCIAVCAVACKIKGLDAGYLVQTLDEMAETEDERNRLLAVISTMTDLQVDTDDLFGNCNPTIL